MTNNRIKAGANLDGLQWGNMVVSKLNQPFLYLSADWPTEHENLNEHAYINKSKSYFYEGLIKNSAHSNFMDIPLMIPFQKLSQASSINPYLSLRITNELLVAFFDKHLKNEENDLEKINETYSDLDLTIYKP